MPYRRKGKTVQVKKRGRWRRKATARSITSAKRMLRTLRAAKKGYKRRKTSSGARYTRRR
jgi:hypothetical protein